MNKKEKHIEFEGSMRRIHDNAYYQAKINYLLKYPEGRKQNHTETMVELYSGWIKPLDELEQKIYDELLRQHPEYICYNDAETRKQMQRLHAFFIGDKIIFKDESYKFIKKYLSNEHVKRRLECIDVVRKR